MQKLSIAVAIGLTFCISYSSYINSPAEADTNQSSNEILKWPSLGEEWGSSKYQPLCPNQKYLSFEDFGKLNQLKIRQHAMMACGLIEAMLRNANHDERGIRFLLVTGAATAGSLVLHGEIQKGLRLFYEIEKILAPKTKVDSISDVEAVKIRSALWTFYNSWGASALVAGDHATALDKVNLAIGYSSTSECSSKCNDLNEEGLLSLNLLALLQSGQGEHIKAAETRKTITEYYRVATANSSRSIESIQQRLIQALIDEGWDRLDIGDFSGTAKLISEAQESATSSVLSKFNNQINAIKAALDYRIGNRIATTNSIGSKLDRSAYSFVQGDKITALRFFSDSVKDIIHNAEELKQRVYDKELAFNYKEKVLSLHQAIYSMALANNDEYLDTAASILSLNTYGLILDIELGRYAGNGPDNNQLTSHEGNSAGFGLSLVHPKDISKNLKSNELLIEFRRFQEWQVDNGRASRPLASSAYIGISVDSKGTVRSRRIGNAADIDAMISRTLSNNSQNYFDAAKNITEMGDHLLAKFALSNEMRPTIYISADGEINRFPFSAYAILKKNLILRPIISGRRLLMMQKRSIPRSRGESLVLSSPNYGIAPSPRHPSSIHTSTKLMTWQALPYARKEGELVSQIIRGKHFYGDSANEIVIKSAKNPYVLHVASHGYFRGNVINDDAPSSAIVLAGANNTHLSFDNTSDGYLTAAELSRLDLDGTELVVLSACSTGQGDIRTGEGVYGLQRALTVAGARSTLLSLWKVDDEATAEFMKKFYTRIKAGEGRSDALAAVQREYRDGVVGKGQWKDPYYWAAWQLVGDWRPIKGF